MVVLAAFVLLVMMAPPQDVEAGMDFSKAGTLPIMEGGRIKPLEGYARTVLMQISSRQDWRNNNGDVHPAVQWLFDVVAGSPPKRAEDTDSYNQPGFRIESDSFRQRFNLPDVRGKKLPNGRERTDPYAYTFIELAPALKDIAEVGKSLLELEVTTDFLDSLKRSRRVPPAIRQELAYLKGKKYHWLDFQKAAEEACDKGDPAHLFDKKVMDHLKTVVTGQASRKPWIRRILDRMPADNAKVLELWMQYAGMKHFADYERPQKVFRIENDQVLEFLMLERRPGSYRYSFGEILPRLALLFRESRTDRSRPRRIARRVPDEDPGIAPQSQALRRPGRVECREPPRGPADQHR